MCRIMDAFFIENERPGQCAYFQQPVLRASNSSTLNSGLPAQIATIGSSTPGLVHEAATEISVRRKHEKTVRSPNRLPGYELKLLAEKRIKRVGDSYL